MLALGIWYQQILKLIRQHISAGFVYRLLPILSQASIHPRQARKAFHHMSHIHHINLGLFESIFSALFPFSSYSSSHSTHWETENKCGKCENLIIVLGVVVFLRSPADIDTTGSYKLSLSRIHNQECPLSPVLGNIFPKVGHQINLWTTTFAAHSDTKRYIYV